MVDKLTPEKRSWQMSQVRSVNTGPELRVRRVAHRLGLRYRLHGRDLPGKPDIVMAGRRAVVFVHGCFWHRHEGCRRATSPATRPDYWQAKFDATLRRDAAALDTLTQEGWRVVVIWECQTHSDSQIEDALKPILQMPRKN